MATLRKEGLPLEASSEVLRAAKLSCLVARILRGMKDMKSVKDYEAVSLTTRERSVLELVAEGLSAKEAAMELAIAPCTIERHVENVRLKTRTRNRAHLIAFVIREGLIA